MTPVLAAALLVMLDPGHQPCSPGAYGASGRLEYRLNDQMVGLLERSLSAAGARTGRTRGENECVDLPTRARRAEQARAALLLSIHHDSVHPEDMTAGGRVGLCRAESRAARGFSMHVRAEDAEAVRVARALGRALKAAGFSPTPYHAALFPVVDASLGIYDRQDLTLLKQSAVPVVLLECGFIIEPDEERTLRQPEVRARLTAAVVEGLRAAGLVPQAVPHRGPQ